MDEYIRKQDAIDAFNRIKNTLQNPKTAHYDTLMFYEIEDVLEDVEPADVVPVVHSQWKYKCGEIQCPKCGNKIHRIDLSGYLNFCPNCGAKMDCERKE